MRYISHGYFTHQYAYVLYKHSELKEAKYLQHKHYLNLEK